MTTLNIFPKDSNFSEKDYLKRLMELTPSSVYWKNLDGTYLGCNQALLKLVGASRFEEVIGKKDSELPWKESAKELQKNDKAVISSGKLLHFEESVKLSDSDFIQTFLTNKMPLVDKFGKITGVIGSSIDITLLKQAQKKAEVAGEAKREFLENMRHDVRTPLAGIVGCAQLLLSKIHDPTISDYAKDLVDSSNALLDFHNNILESIQVATAEIPLVNKKFDLRKQLEEIINLNKSLAAEKKLTLNLNYDEMIPLYLIGDPIRVQRIILELLSNALKFTKQGLIKVGIKLKKKESKEVIVEISVRDTGIGIPKDKQEEIFVRFKRLIPSYKGIYNGIGLGLTTVKKFVDDLDGEIYVNSESGKGSTFTCLLAFKEPMVMDETGLEEIPLPANYNLFNKLTEATQRDVPDSTATNRILIIEDNVIAAKAAAGVMSEFNCTINIALDGKTAMELLRKNVYQLVLMDIGLPDTNGIALTHRIRLNQWQKNHATVPIIGLTAHIGETKQECLDAGMNAVIHKPLKKETVQELLITFVHNEFTDETTLARLPIIKGAVVDFDVIKKTLRDEKGIEECRQLMITGLSEDLVKLTDWHPSKDWKSIQSIAHKWQGGAVYYGAMRLEQACKNFNDYWASGQRESVPFEKMYQQLILEMEAVIEVCCHKP